jgi:hypothetical protein
MFRFTIRGQWIGLALAVLLFAQLVAAAILSMCLTVE